MGFSFLVGLSLLAGAPAEAAYPGQNGRIACTGERSTVLPAPGPSPRDPFNGSRFEIYTMDPDTGDAGGVTLLTSNRSDDFDPDYSPDGKRLVIDSSRSGGSEAYTMDADGTDVTRITFRSQEEFQGDWSPDGRRLLFQVGAGTDFDILRSNADGSNQELITGDPANEGRPAWTVDGSRFAFDSIRTGNFEIYTGDPEFGDFAPLMKLTDNPARDLHPQYSPDGRKIVFQSNRDTVAGQPNNNEIYTMNADGTGVTRLTSNATDDPGTGTPTSQINEAEDSDPIWSPDGTKILFQSRRAVGGDLEVYTMNVDGTGVKRLTNNPGFDGRCDWQPRVAGAPPVYDVPNSVTPPGTPSAGKLRTSLTLRARPRRDRRPPFRFVFSGRVRIPSGVSSASVCGGRVRLVVKKRRRTVASGSARVSKRCTYRKRITIRSTRRTGRRRARLRVSASFGGNASLSRASRSTTTVRIF